MSAIPTIGSSPGDPGTSTTSATSAPPAIARATVREPAYVVDVEPMMQSGYTTDTPFILLAFKCCVEADDHIINKLAVAFTRNASSKRATTDGVLDEFRGSISHVEILIKERFVDLEEDSEDEHGGEEWYRYSIMKKIGKRQGNKIVYFPGKVHRIKTEYVNGSMNVKNYRFYRLDLPARMVQRALFFLTEQYDSGAGFNTWGYLLNFTSPILLGVSNYEESKRRKTNKWFCTELIVCALQVAGALNFNHFKACAISPNQLFDMIVEGGGAYLVYSGDYLSQKFTV